MCIILFQRPGTAQVLDSTVILFIFAIVVTFVSRLSLVLSLTISEQIRIVLSNFLGVNAAQLSLIFDEQAL